MTCDQVITVISWIAVGLMILVLILNVFAVILWLRGDL